MQSSIKLAVITALGILSSQALATGLVSIPTTGFAVGSDTSAYTLCNTTGNFGSGSGANAPVKPTTGANNTCAVFPADELDAPVSGFDLIAAATRSAVMNNSYTNNTNVTVAEVTEYVWMNSAGTECIYGMKVNNFGVDYNKQASGNQYFEVNDVARGGFGSLAVSAGYSTIPTIAEPVYRIGRTFTAVQHRGTGGTPATGYLAQPLTIPTPAFNGAINGINSWSSPLAVPTAYEQSAALNSNWIDFTTDVNYKDDDGSTSAASGMMYVKAACSYPSGTGPDDYVSNDGIRLRQTFQELSGDGVTANPFIEVSVPGYIVP